MVEESRAFQSREAFTLQNSHKWVSDKEKRGNNSLAISFKGI